MVRPFIRRIQMSSGESVTFTIEARGDIASAQNLLSTILALRDSRSDHKFWYRGLPDCGFELMPSVGRKQRYAGQCLTFSLDQEKSLLHRFRRRAYPYVGRAMTAGEAIFLARHHGLPTRLLDWTANALFALYFACAGDRKEDQKKAGRVWAMRRRAGTEDQDLDAFKLARCKGESKLFNYLVTRSAGTRDPGGPPHAIRIIYPFYNSPRLLAQDGAFTIHSNPQRSIESYKGEPFKTENLDIERLYCWCVPAENKAKLVKQTERTWRYATLAVS
jgi:FRG domain-containing protein